MVHIGPRTYSMSGLENPVLRPRVNCMLGPKLGPSIQFTLELYHADYNKVCIGTRIQKDDQS